MRWSGGLSVQERLRVFTDSLGIVGAGFTLRRSLEYALSDKPHRDHSFDRRYGTDTAGSVQPQDLGIESEDNARDAVQYLPSPAPITRRLIANLKIDPRAWSFVDFGCGKGRVVMVAAEQPFRRVLGIEISKPLHATAVANAQLFQKKRPSARPIEIQLGDARTIALPEGDTVFHFYHPFGPPVLRDVLANIGASLDRAPRRVRVAYLAAFPEALDVLDACAFLKRDRFVRCVEPKYSWASYSNR